MNAAPNRRNGRINDKPLTLADKEQLEKLYKLGRQESGHCADNPLCAFCQQPYSANRLQRAQKAPCLCIVCAERAERQIPSLVKEDPNYLRRVELALITSSAPTWDVGGHKTRV